MTPKASQREKRLSIMEQPNSSMTVQHSRTWCAEGNIVEQRLKSGLAALSGKELLLGNCAVKQFRRSLRGSFLRGGYNISLHVPLAAPAPAPTPPPPTLFFLFSSTGPTSVSPFASPYPGPPHRNTQANVLATPGADRPFVSARTNSMSRGLATDIFYFGHKMSEHAARRLGLTMLRRVLLLSC